MMENAKLFDEKLILSRIADGDHLAFRQFFDLYKEKLFTFIYGLTHSKVNTEEILQDVFLKFWEARSTLHKIDNPRAYIFRMARNRTLDLLTKIGRDQKLMKQLWANISISEEFTEQILQARESQNLIRQAMDELSDKQKKIVELSLQKLQLIVLLLEPMEAFR